MFLKIVYLPKVSPDKLIVVDNLLKAKGLRYYLFLLRFIIWE